MIRSQTFNRSILGLLMLAVPFLAVAVEEANEDTPSFVYETIYNPNSAPVLSVITSQPADIVLLKGGLEQGLRRGMVCRVERGIRNIAELIIIESRIDRAAALILDLSSEHSIQTGDIARIKTIQIN